MKKLLLSSILLTNLIINMSAHTATYEGFIDGARNELTWNSWILECFGIKSVDRSRKLCDIAYYDYLHALGNLDEAEKNADDFQKKYDLFKERALLVCVAAIAIPIFSGIVIGANHDGSAAQKTLAGLKNTTAVLNYEANAIKYCISGILSLGSTILHAGGNVLNIINPRSNEGLMGHVNALEKGLLK